MKRFWIALGATILTGMAHANATLYGLVDEYVENMKVGSDDLVRVTSGGIYGSRWGLRGDEDLGNGLKAVFKLESGFGADTGNAGQGGRLFGRQSYVGLSGKWGQVLVGRQYASIYTPIYNSDVDVVSIFSVPGQLYAYNGQTLRQDNVVKYVLPAIGSLQGEVSYAPGEVAGKNSDHQIGANLSVGVGPATLMAGYNDNNISSDTINNQRSYVVGVSANFANYTFAAQYFKDRTDKKSGPDFTVREWSAGVKGTFGSFTGLAQIGRVWSDRFDDASEEAWLIGGNYALSKRTELYLRVAHVRDENNASDAAWYGFADVPANDSNRTVAVGIFHKF